ncbi:replication protein [Pseudomonas guariconensis]|uniref:replication protein n=1 Tax=Pseudomonas guariconensis TaxID=1288410 RepID=UPI002D1F7F96|nr:replication protein [Pseudomonas guariconensis]MEB3840498.1 replication protein [Pseudomonas guariconensis]MEB3873366.1 replication protein [Pseudomonas guariconensis]MEB3879733.1 replication protein [Pseudomonas guariconensis]MEB3895811.1 replication protein [Pseudomonas guariconensis]
MTNIVPLRNTGGFTRMDNQLMDGLMAINLSAHEMKVVLYVAKATLNFNEGAQRIPATAIAKATNVHPDTISKAISGLLRRRVLFREGGARGDIGLCDPKEWVFVERPKQTNTSDSAQIIRIGSEPKQTKTADSLLYSKKETPYVTLPSEEITCPPSESDGPSVKADRKAPFGKAQMLADNPHGLDESLIADYLGVRKAKRAPMTARVWVGLNAKLEQCKAFGVPPAKALAIAVDNGWQGFEVDWIVKRAGTATQSPGKQPSRHYGFADRDYTAGLTRREDGTYAL